MAAVCLVQTRRRERLPLLVLLLLLLFTFAEAVPLPGQTVQVGELEVFLRSTRDGIEIRVFDSLDHIKILEAVASEGGVQSWVNPQSSLVSNRFRGNPTTLRLRIKRGDEVTVLNVPYAPHFEGGVPPFILKFAQSETWLERLRLNLRDAGNAVIERLGLARARIAEAGRNIKENSREEYLRLMGYLRSRHETCGSGSMRMVEQEIEDVRFQVLSAQLADAGSVLMEEFKKGCCVVADFVREVVGKGTARRCDGSRGDTLVKRPAPASEAGSEVDDQVWEGRARFVNYMRSRSDDVVGQSCGSGSQRS